MTVTVFSATFLGITPYLIEIEAAANRGTPDLVILGLTGTAAHRLKERITSALQASGIKIRSKRVVVNVRCLAPLTTETLDFPIAIVLLTLFGIIRQPPSETHFFGELSLDGSLRPLSQMNTLLGAAQQLGAKQLVFPAVSNWTPTEFVDIQCRPVRNLSEYLSPEIAPIQQSTRNKISQPESVLAFDRIHGYERTKRALLIAATGHHHILFRGTITEEVAQLIQATREFLPQLQLKEKQEIRCLSFDGAEITQRPFVAPLATDTLTQLLGEKKRKMIGEICRANHGVLFLRNLPTFRSEILSPLYQMLTQQNSRENLLFPFTPKDVLCVATAECCPCGANRNATRQCRCSPRQLAAYQNILAQPLFTAFSLCISLEESHKSSRSTSNVASHHLLTQLREVECWRQECIQTEKPKNQNASQLTLLEEELSENARKRAYQINTKYHLPLHRWSALLQVARTIADLAKNATITEDCILEAHYYIENGS